MDSTCQDPAAVVRGFIEAWNANDLERILAYLSEDVTYHNMPVAPIYGRSAVRDYLGGKGGFDWVDWKLLSLAVDGNKVLTERVDDFGWQGRRISLPIMGIFEVEDGLIRAWRDYFDMAGYRTQLSAAPATGD